MLINDQGNYTYCVAHTRRQRRRTHSKIRGQLNSGALSQAKGATELTEREHLPYRAKKGHVPPVFPVPMSMIGAACAASMREDRMIQ